MNWREPLQHFLQKKGYRITRYPLLRFIDQYGIDIVLDVGANVGQYGLHLRELGYGGQIISFEPSASAYADLSRVAAEDPKWIAVHTALGGEAREDVLHLSGNSTSSSVLDILPLHVQANESTRYVGEERIQVQRLDDIFSEFCSADDRVMLKVDTQGYEREVLRGATEVLPEIIGLQMELSLVPLYAGESLVEDMVGFARSHGFTPFWFDHGFKEPETQRLLQIDGLFFRMER